MDYDVIIIGAGPAGISSSLYTRKGKFKNINFVSRRRSLRKDQKDLELLWV